MTLKESLAIATGQVEELTSKLAAVETEKNELSVKLATAETKLAETESELNGLAAEHENTKGAFAQVTAQLGEAGEKISKLETEAKTGEERAREIAARAGVLVIPAKAAPASISDPAAPAGVATTMSRADFDAMGAGRKMAFCKAGGRITD